MPVVGLEQVSLYASRRPWSDVSAIVGNPLGTQSTHLNTFAFLATSVCIRAKAGAMLVVCYQYREEM
jgi:hypothetical protein